MDNGYRRIETDFQWIIICVRCTLLYFRFVTSTVKKKRKNVLAIVFYIILYYHNTCKQLKFFS